MTRLQCCFLLLVLTLTPALAPAAFAQADERVFYASVVDKNGALVPGLTEKDFIVREDGQAREILRVTRDAEPLQIALLIDNSAAMRNYVSDVRRAAQAFIDNTREGVQVAIITLGERPTIAVQYTADHDALKKGAARLFATPDSGNYLLDGIAETTQGFEKRTMWRPVIAVITGVGDLSYRQYQEVLRSLKESGAALNVLTLGTSNGGVDREFVVGKGTADTGGRSDVALAAMSLESKAAQMATELSSQYRITYARPPRLIPPKSIEVDTRNPDLRARGMLVKTDKERQ